MSITNEVDPSVETALQGKANAAGISLEMYVGQVLAQEAEPHHSKVQRSLEMLRRVRAKVGPIPDGALVPELLYGDR